MLERKFEKGRCYFLVGYLDRQFKLPFINSYVFLGTEAQAKSDRWIFQDVHSFSKYGEQHTSDDSKGVDVMRLDQDALDTMLDSAALAEEFARLKI